MVLVPFSVLIGKFKQKAQELRDCFGDDGRARTLEWAAAQVSDAIAEVESTPFDLTEAARQSGYSADHLSRLIRESKLPNAGRKGSPRIRPADLPIKSERSVASRRARRYDPKTDARALRGHA